MLKRLEWEFEYTAAVLATAAETKMDHHSNRQHWWEDKKDDVMEEIRASGIEISESQANLYSNTSEGMEPRVLVNSDLQRKLSECYNKIRQHRQAVLDYDGWRQILKANPESRLKLKHDDWLYFFGG